MYSTDCGDTSSPRQHSSFRGFSLFLLFPSALRSLLFCNHFLYTRSFFVKKKKTFTLLIFIKKKQSNKMRSQALLAVLYASGAIAGGGTYMPTDPALAHRAPEKFPWPELLDNPYMAPPVVWYQIGQIKIWTDTRGVNYLRDGTKFETLDQCVQHCLKYSVVHTAPIDKPTEQGCKNLCISRWNDVKLTNSNKYQGQSSGNQGSGNQGHVTEYRGRKMHN